MTMDVGSATVPYTSWLRGALAYFPGNRNGIELRRLTPESPTGQSAPVCAESRVVLFAPPDIPLGQRGRMS
jgi:hypothetical protein